MNSATMNTERTIKTKTMNANLITEGWVSISERLPEHSRDVIIVQKDKTIMMARYIPSGGGFWQMYFSDTGLQYDSWRNEQVTHWMSLPEPPSVGGN
jgi:hypothetical protein